MDTALFKLGGQFIEIKEREGFKELMTILDEDIEYLHGVLENTEDELEIWRTQGCLKNCKGLKDKIIGAIEYHIEHIEKGR